MDKKLPHLLHQIQYKSVPKDIELDLIRQGDIGFDALMELFTSPEANENQLINAFKIMFQMCSKSTLGKCSDLFSVALRHAEDSRIGVRSASALTLMAMLNLNRISPNFYPSGIISEEIALDAIKLSIESGLEEKHKKNIINFVAEFDRSSKAD